ncbi:MAG: Ig-like domain-containing protein [Spirochaetia bacterium]
MRKIVPVLLLPALLITAACRFDMRPPEIIKSTLPNEAGCILGPEDSPSITFSRAMDRTSVESLVRITGKEGGVPGIWRWEESKAVFTRHGTYRTGESYLLEAVGLVKDKRGASHTLSISLPFYMEKGAVETVEVTSAEPPGGASLESPFSPITLTFSFPMEKTSVKNALRVYPIINFALSWGDEGRICTLQPVENGWKAHSTYTVSLDSSAVSESGNPLHRPFEATFYAESEPPPLSAPELTTVQLLWPPPFPETSHELDTLEEDETFRMEFDSPPDRESIEYSFSISPGYAGSLHWTSERRCVFLPEPEERFRADTEYRIQLTTDARSIEGGTLAEPFEHSFSGAVSPPRALILDGSPSDDLPVTLPHASTVGFTPEGTLGSYTFIWKFDKDVLTDHERIQLQEKLRLTPVFPPDISYPVVVHLIWTSPDTLVCQIEGAGLGAEGRTCYYSLTPPSLSSGGEEEETIILEYSP